MSAIPLDGYLRPTAASAYLGISVRHLRTLVRRRVLPVIHLGRRCTLFCRHDLDRAIAKFRSAAIGEVKS